MSSILPFTTLFPSSPSALRFAAILPKPAAATTTDTTSTTTPTAPTAADTAASVEAARTQNIQNQDNGVMGLVHTSLTGLNNFLKNLPSRKTLLGE